MSTSAQIPGKGQPTPAAGKAKRSQREVARTGAIVVLAILLTLFAVFNLKEVKVSYVFGSGKAPLIVVIVISVLFGIVLTYLAERLQQRKKKP
ncbi:MAG TPA: lipopolysaccharide assembly protein LapA domain-containing protein [Solirubrobacteraceae bacterium]|jgi:uncharacterized integral membrane protein|nr:lipopolysaccharide assembly protein LapA domain-containing protein [Solirubrobacteraceae bacterium]